MTTLPQQPATQQPGHYRYYICVRMDANGRPVRWQEVKQETYEFCLKVMNTALDGPVAMRRWEVGR